MKLAYLDPPDPNPGAAVDREPRQLVSDLFHQLSQPLTSLCCGLELALLQRPTADEYDEVVKRALDQAERVSWLAMSLREIFEAGQAGDNPEVLELRRAIEDAVGDLSPVAESAGVQICYCPGPTCPVRFDAHRLRQGLFHLVGALIGAGGHGAAVKIELEERVEPPLLAITVSDRGFDGAATAAGTEPEHPSRELAQRLGIGIARAIFEAGGGSFNLESGPQALSVKVKFLRGGTTPAHENGRAWSRAALY